MVPSLQHSDYMRQAIKEQMAMLDGMTEEGAVWNGDSGDYIIPENLHPVSASELKSPGIG